MRLCTLASLLFIAAALVPVRAQDDAPHADTHEFTAGGRTHIINYPASAEDSPNAALVIEAIQATLPAFNEIWDTDSPPVFVKVLTAESPSDIIAQAGRFRRASIPIPGTDTFEERDVCLLTVFNNADTRDTAGLLITVAHEIAHCYQAYFIPAMETFLEDPDDWWTEGSAEWLATHIYEESTATPTIGNYQQDFIDHHSTDLIEGTLNYDAMFFWAALDQTIGLDTTMAFLKAMPQEPEQYAEHLMSLSDPAATFHAYGRLAAEGALPYQPTPDDLFADAGAERVSSFPQTVDLFTFQFSFDVLTLELPPLDEDQGVSLTASGLSDLAMRASVIGGERLLDGATVELCPVAEPIRLLVSRVESDDITSNAQITVDAIPCETPDDGATLPECLLGTWHVTEFPPFPGVTDVAIVSGTQAVHFAEDGLVTVLTEAFTIQMTTDIVLTLTVDGSQVVFRIDSISTDGGVTTSPVSADLGIATANINGTELQLNLNDFEGAIVAPAPLRFECGADTLRWYFAAGGVETNFTLVRVE